MSRAASSSVPSKRLNTAIITRKPNGKVQTTWTPSADEYQAGGMPICLSKVRETEAEQNAGHHQSGEDGVEQYPAPRNGLRNAIASMVENKAVISMTMIARISERISAPCMSPDR